ncbi:MAG TPA: ATP-binding protein [Thermoanaerobaculia bacterium]|nr:ATP-binding protein [Thermoanaerobaculia bacterium]
MDTRTPVLLAWSGGKDSALALDELRRSPLFAPVGLLTTMTEGRDRIHVHGVRRDLLLQQVEALGLPLTAVPLPPGASNAVYQERMAEALAPHRERGIRHVAFGDLFLEDIRQFREQSLAATGLGMEPLFPLWEKPTAELARQFVERGFRALLVAVDAARLAPSFAGRPFDLDLLRDLPEGIDPCGENGEFHTFVTDGPGFSTPVPCTPGPLSADGPYQLCDLLPVPARRTVDT